MSASRPPLLVLAILVVIVTVAVAILPRPLAALAAAIVVIAAAMLARSGNARSEGGAPSATSLLDELTTLIAPLDEGVVALDADHIVLAANPAAARIVGRPLASMLGVSLIQAIRDHDVAEVARGMAGVPTVVHLSQSRHDVVATGLQFEEGRPYTLLLMNDVTDLTHARRARSELVANVSHELRTPLTAARALAETLHSGVEEPVERDRFLARLVEELERLSDIVQRLLWLARLEAGSEPFAVEPHDGRGLLAEAAARFAPVAEQQRVRVEVDAAPDAGAVLADRERVLEVLANLLDNAVRHSPEGAAVTLRTHREDTLVHFEVGDQGPGIPTYDRERVFERFYTGDRSREARGGSGLGLAIARHIVQRLGGRIWIADQTGPGATLCFALPAAPEAPGPPRPSA